MKQVKDYTEEELYDLPISEFNAVMEVIKSLIAAGYRAKQQNDFFTMFAIILLLPRCMNEEIILDLKQKMEVIMQKRQRNPHD